MGAGIRTVGSPDAPLQESAVTKLRQPALLRCRNPLRLAHLELRQLAEGLAEVVRIQLARRLGVLP